MPLNVWRNWSRFSPQADIRRPSLGLPDVAVGLGVLATLYLVAHVGAESLVKFNPPDVIPSVSLDPRNLPNYVARSTIRMFIALGASTLFALVYGYAAARNKRAERVLIPLLDGDGIHRSVPGKPVGFGNGLDFRHLHGSGLEHDLLVLSVLAVSSTRTRGNGGPVPPVKMVAIHSPGIAGFRDRTGLERNDELWGWLVFPGRKRGHQRPEQAIYLAGDWFVCRRSYPGKELLRSGMGDRDDGGLDPSN